MFFTGLALNTSGASELLGLLTTPVCGWANIILYVVLHCQEKLAKNGLYLLSSLMTADIE